MLRTFAFIVILVSICFSQQTHSSKQISLSDGENIVRKARETMGLSSLSTTTFRIKLRVLQQNTKESSIENQDDIEILSLNKIRSVSVSLGTERSGSIKFTGTTTLNEKKFKQTVESEINGQRFVKDITEPVSTDTLNRVLKTDTLKKTGAKSSYKPLDNKTIFSNEIWTMVFPLILTNPIENPAKLEYIGRAKAGEQIANIVKTKSTNGDDVQLFFDEKTSNLLMMIVKGTQPFGDYEDRYYYSNREKKADVLIPTKVKIERKFTPNNGGNQSVTYKYIDIVGFEVNPEIKKDLFDIK